MGAHAPVAQLDRASVYGTEGREFESLRARCPNRQCLRRFGFLVSGAARIPGDQSRTKRLSAARRRDALWPDPGRRRTRPGGQHREPRKQQKLTADHRTNPFQKRRDRHRFDALASAVVERGVLVDPGAGCRVMTGRGWRGRGLRLLASAVVMVLGVALTLSLSSSLAPVTASRVAPRSVPSGLVRAIHSVLGPGPVGLGRSPLVAGITPAGAGWRCGPHRVRSRR